MSKIYSYFKIIWNYCISLDAHSILVQESLQFYSDQKELSKFLNNIYQKFCSK